MSSIISDIFYGSKQNILDNYLIHRYDPQVQSKDQPSSIYTPYIQLVIQIPNTESLAKPQYFQVRAEMGTITDQNILEVPPEIQKNDTPSTLLTLNCLDKTDLNKYTNIKITISEGKYKRKVFGYIPIESIKNLISYPTPQKMVTLQMKGKQFIGFNSIQCFVKAQFPSNNILNSLTSKSMEKDSHSVSKGASRDHDVSGLSKESIIEMKEFMPSFQKQTLPKGRRRVDLIARSSQEANIYIDDENLQKNKLVKKNQKHKAPIKQYESQLKPLKLLFSDLNINQTQNDSIFQLKDGEDIFEFDQIREFKSVSKEGFILAVLKNNEKIGTIFISPLLLTINTIQGELPILSQEEKCLGTVKIRSGQQKQSSIELCLPKNSTYSNIPQVQKEKNVGFSQILMSLNLQKIIMINSINQNLQQSLYIDPLKAEIFNFSKIEALDKLELIIRVDEHTFRFNEVKLKFISDREQMKVVELRRKEGFFLHLLKYFPQQIKIQIQLYSNLRLLSYSSFCLSKNDQIDSYFLPGITQFQHCQCVLSLQILKLSTPKEYFSTTKILFKVIESLLSRQLLLKDTSDSSIKTVLNHHKKATYVQTKKLFLLLQKIMKNVISYQNSTLVSLVEFGKQEISQQFLKFSSLLVRELVVMDRELSLCIEKDQFQKLVSFYTSEYLSYESKEFEELKKNTIEKIENNKVIYPFFVAGIYYRRYSIQEEDKQMGQGQEKPTKDQVKQQIPSIKELAIMTQPTAFVSKIILTNIHLLNNGKIPNVSINLCKKIHYSNANPEFIVEKDINLMQPIKIYHKSIAKDDFVLLTQIRPNRRQIHYELDLTDKAKAKIQWGC